jgi:hypothetical protein
MRAIRRPLRQTCLTPESTMARSLRTFNAREMRRRPCIPMRRPRLLTENSAKRISFDPSGLEPRAKFPTASALTRSAPIGAQ